MKLNSAIIQLFIFFALFVSCAKTDEAAKESALREARFHLTNGDCSDAEDALDQTDEDKTDADYVATKASVLACFAGYRDSETVANLLAIDTSTLDATNVFGTLAAFTSSDENSADATSYTKIIEAITYILDADDGSTPSTTNRLAYYGRSAGNDLSMQAIFMLATGLGKFFAYYGNTNSAGLKGAGSASNGCIANYTFDVAVNGDISGDANYGSCGGASDGHPDLDTGVVASATVFRRMCEAIVMYNNFAEILSNMDLTTNTTLGDLSDIESTLQQVYTAAQLLESSYTWNNNAVTSMQSITSQSECEALSTDDIQRFMVVLFEYFL